VTDTAALAGRPVVAGSGLAGLVTAWALAPEPCVVVTPGRLAEDVASSWAQGGLAAALAADDAPRLHALDTLAAGSHLGDPEVVGRITTAAPAVVDLLMGLGVPFDRTEDGSLSLGLEGGHSRRRIVHIDGDRTGAGIMRVLAAVVRRLPSVTLLERSRLTAVSTDPEGRVTGVDLVGPRGPAHIDTDRVVLATGGAAAIFRDTTNPLGSHGHGLALAARAGATLSDLEFVQFHPTALDVGRDPMPLLTEALRGAGGLLVSRGERFVEELAPRDVVAAAVWRELRLGERVALDVRHIPDLADRFSGLLSMCADVGIDPTRDLLPVRPAAHYHMGGVRVDARGRTDVPGLWAAGEVARTGLHGANRLASNSLLEAAVTGRAVAADLLDRGAPDDTVHGSGGGGLDHPAGTVDRAARSAPPAGALEPSSPGPRPVPVGLAEATHAGRPDLREVRSLMSEHVGVTRAAEGLEYAASCLEPHVADDHALVGWLIATAALARTESIGGHLRVDSVGSPEQVSA
jgi:L-aspartate oxidase